MKNIISVIIPFYNARYTLGRCLSSMAAQTCRDFELILIDDGSTDGSADVCRPFLPRLPHVTLLSQANAGVSAARNRGLDYASGQYVCFVDADDAMEPEYLSGLLNSVNGEGEIVISGFRQLAADGGECAVHNFTPHTVVQKELTNLFLKERICSNGWAWGKLYDRELIARHQIRFEEGICFSEDLIFFLDCLMYADVVNVSGRADYLYYDNIGSLSARIFPFEQEMAGFSLFLDRLGRLAPTLQSENGQSWQVGALPAVEQFVKRILLSIPMYERAYARRAACYRKLEEVCLLPLARTLVAASPFLRAVTAVFRCRLYPLADALLRLAVRNKRRT